MISKQMIELKNAMKEKNIQAYIIPTSDFHDTETAADYFAARKYFSGFTGSAGVLVVLEDKAALWTDGRYFIQAENELANSGIDLMKQGQERVPSIEEYILSNLKEGQTVGFDGRTIGYNDALKYKEVFEALATGTPVAGYPRIKSGDSSIVSTTKDGLAASLDKVLPYVKQYGIPTIFGSYAALSNIYNPLAASSGYPNVEDSADIRRYGFVQVYKGVRCVELPNYLVNGTWAYDPRYVFVMPSDVKPVKVALKGEMYIQKNVQAVGSEKWEAHKMIGVGVAMANNYAIIKIK